MCKFNECKQSQISLNTYSDRRKVNAPRRVLKFRKGPVTIRSAGSQIFFSIGKPSIILVNA